MSRAGKKIGASASNMGKEMMTKLSVRVKPLSHL